MPIHETVKKAAKTVAKGATDAAGSISAAVSDASNKAAGAVAAGTKAAADAGGKAVEAISNGAGAVAEVGGKAIETFGAFSTVKRTQAEEQRESLIMEKNETTELTESNAAKVLDTLYSKALEGIPQVSRSVDDLASDYLDKHPSPEKAAKELAKNQILKCGASGFITGLGGLITLPVAIPANISSVLYVQMRMIAAIAKIGGYDIKSDQVQTMVYMCLTGQAIADVIKDVGIRVGEKTLEAAIKKIPGAALVKINQRIGFRLLTKFGEKGIINLGKLVPVAGGVIGGGIDAASTVAISKNAINVFITHETITSGEATGNDAS